MQSLLVDCKPCCGWHFRETSHTVSFVALQELAQQRGRFGPAQQGRIAALHQFAKDQRQRRQRGPSALERRRDTTSFEAARREWGGRTVSARGTVMTGAHVRAGAEACPHSFWHAGALAQT
jgi:hypothetical protein